LIIQPDKNEEYRSLCAIEHPVTETLFGDDLGKKVEDITKANKIGSKLSGNTRAERRYPGSRKHHQGDYWKLQHRYLDILCFIEK
jgi:hypothetical protein